MGDNNSTHQAAKKIHIFLFFKKRLLILHVIHNSINYMNKLENAKIYGGKMTKDFSPKEMELFKNDLIMLMALDTLRSFSKLKKGQEMFELTKLSIMMQQDYRVKFVSEMLDLPNDLSNDMLASLVDFSEYSFYGFMDDMKTLMKSMEGIELYSFSDN